MFDVSHESPCSFTFETIEFGKCSILQYHPFSDLISSDHTRHIVSHLEKYSDAPIDADMFSSYYSKLVNNGLNSAHHHTDSECQARSGSLSDQDLESFQSALNSLDKSLGETGWITPETSSRLQDSADNVDKELSN